MSPFICNFIVPESEYTLYFQVTVKVIELHYNLFLGTL